MARIGGRNAWIAVPAGLVCAAVVVALVWLSLPMAPVTVAWIGEMLRAAASRPLAASHDPPPPSPLVSSDHLECRTFYPDDLWTELVWTPDALLSQTTTPPVTSVTALTDALAPTVRLTCAWRADQGARTVSTTLATVGADAASVADAALRGAGFTCDGAGAVVTCARAEGDVVEEHVVRDGYWLSSVETAWILEDYGARLAAHLFG